jgi:uncharacterized membrane protein YczE
MKSLKNWICLFAGFGCFGLGIALMVRANLGLGPWDVFHQGLGFRTGITIGTAGVLTGAVILLGWIPLREKPGFGTVLNVLTIGPVCDLCLLFIPDGEGLALRWAMLLGGVVLTAIGSALYLPTRLGAGPRDGLMMGLHRRYKLSIRLARTVVELCALGFGWWLGGTVGIGTLVFALGIGPTIQFMLGVVKRIGLFR